jgi:hypothetical protein
MHRVLDRRAALLKRLLKIKTTSPRGVVLKIAMGVGAATLDVDEILDASAGNGPVDGLFQALPVDLQAMEA